MGDGLFNPSRSLYCKVKSPLPEWKVSGVMRHPHERYQREASHGTDGLRRLGDDGKPGCRGDHGGGGV